MKNSATVKLALQGKNEEMVYRIVQSCSRTHGAEGAVVYGVRVTNQYDSDDYAEFGDISPNVTEVKRLISILEEGKVTPDQLKYIVEDFLEILYSPDYID